MKKDKIVTFSVSNNNSSGDVSFENTYRENSEDLERYVDKVCISLEEDGKGFGVLECTVFKSKYIEFDERTMWDFADELGSDEESAISVLESNNLSERNLSEINEDLYLENTAIVYIDHLAINKDKRRLGYGKWLLDNYLDIIDVNYNIKVESSIIFINPQNFELGEDNKNRYSEMNKKSEEFKENKKSLIRLLEKNDFKELGGGYYYKDYSRIWYKKE